MPRKVIYNATVELIAEDLGTTEQELRQLVKRTKGYIAKSELRGTAGTRRSGTWTIRVPVNHFDDFREGLVQLGEVQRDSLDSQDVTDQFYDLDARIRTNQAEEESLRKLLTQAQGQQQFFQIRQELNRIRGDLEVQQGQLQRLDKLSAMATYNITIQERKGYVPPETPNFDTRLSRTWADSIDALRHLRPGGAAGDRGAGPVAAGDRRGCGADLAVDAALASSVAASLAASGDDGGAGRSHGGLK